MLTKRIKTGFVFDVSPNSNDQVISSMELDEKLSINNSEIKYNDKNIVDSNLLFIGENYDSLKNLELIFRNSIDIIYIDPPYNTDATVSEKNNLSENEILEKSSKKFVYRDKFSRSGWLNMIKDRVDIAWRLLSDDGVFFASIDDSEQAYLKVLLDEIFGEENFVGCWPRLKSTQGKNDSNSPITKHDYLLIYKKSDNVKWNKKQTDPKYFNLDDNDGRGPYHLKNYISATEGLGYQKSLDFEIEINKKKYIPISKGKRTRWLWNKERIEKAKELGLLVPKGDLVYSKKYLNYEFDDNNDLVESKSNIHYDSLDLIENSFSNKEGTKNLEEIFNEKIFSFPKPTSLIKYCINLIDKKDPIILDFFAGSGTTGQAVLEMNSYDGGNRKFILCTNNAEIEKTNLKIGENICWERIYRVINKMTPSSNDAKYKNKNYDKNIKYEKLLTFFIKYIDISISKNIDNEINELKKSLKILKSDFDVDDESLIKKLFSLYSKFKD